MGEDDPFVPSSEAVMIWYEGGRSMNKLVLVGLLLCGSIAWSDDEVVVRTVGFENGRQWNKISDSFKLGFIAGLIDAWEMRDQTEETRDGYVQIALQPSSNTTLGDLREMVEGVYKHPENLDLPIGWVLMACISVKKGENTSDAVLAALRKYTSGLREEDHPYFLTRQVLKMIWHVNH
jgi:hypothetical protein